MELIVVLDTNAYSDWRRFGRWHEILAHADRILMPVVVMGELIHGFKEGDRLEQNLSKLDTFLGQPQVEEPVFSRTTADIYGDLLHYLRKNGTPIPTNDIWIAACAYEHHALLLTRDKHFEHLPLLRVRNKE